MRSPAVRLLLAHGNSVKLNPSTSSQTSRIRFQASICLVHQRAASTASNSRASSYSSAELTPSSTATQASSRPRYKKSIDTGTDADTYATIPLSKTFVPAQAITSTRGLETTVPAKLETPEPLQREDFPGKQIPLGEQAKYYFALGKSYLRFYKTGFQHIWVNYKEVRKIWRRLGVRHGRRVEQVVKYGLPSASGERERQTLPVLTRDDYQLLLRARHDLGKLLPFSIIFLICGEFTPFVILAIGSAVVPYTCRIPQQEQRDFLRPVRIQSQYKAHLDNLHTQGAAAVSQWQLEFLEAYRLHLHPFTRPFPVLGALWHRFVSGPRLRKHCEQVLCDTILIRREGGFSKLAPREVFLWSFKLGLPALTQHMEAVRLQGSEVDPDSPELKKMVLPFVEAEARRMLSVDWRHVRPEDHWRAVFSPARLPQYNGRVSSDVDH